MLPDSFWYLARPFESFLAHSLANDLNEVDHHSCFTFVFSSVQRTSFGFVPASSMSTHRVLKPFRPILDLEKRYCMSLLTP